MTLAVRHGRPPSRPSGAAVCWKRWPARWPAMTPRVRQWLSALVLGAVALDEAEHLTGEPAGDALARGIVAAMQDIVFRHIDPCVRRVQPAWELVADVRLEVIAVGAVLD